MYTKTIGLGIYLFVSIIIAVVIAIFIIYKLGFRNLALSDLLDEILSEIILDLPHILHSHAVPFIEPTVDLTMENRKQLSIHVPQIGLAFRLHAEHFEFEEDEFIAANHRLLSSYAGFHPVVLNEWSSAGFHRPNASRVLIGLVVALGYRVAYIDVHNLPFL